MTPAPPRAGSSSKVLRPLLAWAVVSILLLTWQYHRNQTRRASVRFAVLIEGRATRPQYLARLNGESYQAGEPAGLWHKELTIQADDAEPFSTNFSVWYGGKDLGQIVLKRSRGTLDLNIKPPALNASVKGTEASKTFTNTTRQFLELPTGRYRVNVSFARFSTESEAVIERQRTNRLIIDPGVTSLTMASVPSNADFVLKSAAFTNVSIQSNTPVFVSDLPVGEYQLRIWRGDYRKTLPLILAKSESNEFKVEFDYATLAITSDPSGARIADDEKILGTTPTNLVLPAGWHRLSITKEGFMDTNVVVTLSANETRTVEATLLNVAYIEAMEQARRYLSGFARDYDRALPELDKALRIRPNDDDALQLKKNIQFNRHLDAAREFRRAGELHAAADEVERALKIDSTATNALAFKSELDRQMQVAARVRDEARREHPAKVLEANVGRIPFHNLFPVQTMSFTGEVKAVSSAIVRALEKKPTWTIRRNATEDSDAIILQAEHRSFAAREVALLVVGQTAQSAVTIHYKLCAYTLSGNLQIGATGLSDESYKPLHPSFMQAANATSAENRLATLRREFRERIEAELR